MNRDKLMRSWRRMMVIGFLAPIVALHPVVSASRTEGATVVVIQGTGAQKGELVGVRESALVLLTKAGDVTIEAAQIESVRIVKKASPVPAAIGLGIAGGAAGLGLAYASGIKSDTIEGGLAIGVGSIVAGALVGVVAGILLTDSLAKDEILLFKGRSDGEIKELMTRLRSQARVPDYK